MTGEGGRVAITGAYGYVGRRLRASLEAIGKPTVALVRSPRRGDEHALRWDLRAAPEPELFEAVDALVHCAYDKDIRNLTAAVEVNAGGTEHLLRVAAQRVRRSIVVSSIAAFPGTKQRYGRTKLAVEDVARRHGAAIVRPGLVYGPRAGAMVGALRRASRMPVVPLPAARSHQFMVHEDDLVATLLAIIDAASPPADPVVVAHPRAVPIRELVRGLATAEGRRARLLPIPWVPLYAMLRTAQSLGMHPPFSADSLWGLAHPPPPPDPRNVASLGVPVRDFDPGGLLG